MDLYFLLLRSCKIWNNIYFFIELNDDDDGADDNDDGGEWLVAYYIQSKVTLPSL